MKHGILLLIIFLSIRLATAQTVDTETGLLDKFIL